jgi:hypothetical protein
MKNKFPQPLFTKGMSGRIIWESFPLEIFFFCFIIDREKQRLRVRLRDQSGLGARDYGKRELSSTNDLTQQ